MINWRYAPARATHAVRTTAVGVMWLREQSDGTFKRWDRATKRWHPYITNETPVKRGNQ